METALSFLCNGILVSPKGDIVVRKIVICSEGLSTEVIDEERDIDQLCVIIQCGFVVGNEFQNGFVTFIIGCEAFDQRNIFRVDVLVAFNPSFVFRFAQFVDSLVLAIDIDDYGSIGLVFDIIDMLAKEFLHKGILKAGVDTTVATITQ